jgi:hypothetical protein
MVATDSSTSFPRNETTRHKEACSIIQQQSSIALGNVKIGSGHSISGSYVEKIHGTKVVNILKLSGCKKVDKDK